MPKCKSCGAEIEWIKTDKGKNAPIDAKPIKVWSQTRGGAWMLIDGHVSHFATCPNANQHRKKE